MNSRTGSHADEKIGHRIQLRRKELKMTAASLSEHIGLSQQQVSRYERGLNKISIEHLINIAGVLDTPIGWFLTDLDGQEKTPVPSYRERHSEDLKKRLEQRWQSLNQKQQQALIAFLDTI